MQSPALGSLSTGCLAHVLQVIVMAFLMQVDGRGGVPEYDFSVASDDCPVFEGTGLKNCPAVG
jgi:hypothetical protein